MNSREGYETIRRELSEIYPRQEAGAMAGILLEAYFGVDRRRRLLEPQARIVPTAAFEQALRELKAHRPLQYVLGETEFADCTLALDERVLIPRPETEELVRRIARAYRGRTPAILDIGTGSGAIAVALARALPGSRVTALDISPDALDVARGNARTNGVAVDFQPMDILKECPEGRYGVIVSNPPYVRESERAAMRPNVLDHEPAAALFVPDDDPLVFYRAIAGCARRALDPGGALWLEINEAFGPPIVALLEERGFREVELFQDMFDKDRMIRATWK
jgi:release factor glutamine methyltransferase